MENRLLNAYDLDKKCVFITDENIENAVHYAVTAMGYAWHSGGRERILHFERLKAPYFLCFDQIQKKKMITHSLQGCPFIMKFELTPPVGYAPITIKSLM